MDFPGAKTIFAWHNFVKWDGFIVRTPLLTLRFVGGLKTYAVRFMDPSSGKVF